MDAAQALVDLGGIASGREICAGSSLAEAAHRGPREVLRVWAENLRLAPIAAD